MPPMTLTDQCEPCGTDTPHVVHIEHRVESRRRKNAEFSREPYRVAVCKVCEHEQSLRMNDA